jgi:hypothetical protein
MPGFFNRRDAETQRKIIKYSFLASWRLGGERKLGIT